MKKRILSLLCVFTMLLTLAPSALAATDSQTLAADTLYTLGLFNGSDEGYRLDEQPTRLHAMAMIARLAGGEDAASADYSHPFADVPDWADGYVGYAYSLGLVQGVTATEFDSYRAVTANAYYTFLLRLLGYSDAQGDFSIATATLFAYRLGIASTANFGTFTRGDMCEATLAALSAPIKGESRTLISRMIELGAVEAAVANALGLSEEVPLTARQIAQQCSAPLFLLHCYNSQEAIDQNTTTSTASGFFISADGVAVTCYHAINGVISAKAALLTGEMYQVEKVLYYDAASDVAVIQVSTTSVDGVKTAAFPYLETSSVDTVHTGDPVYAVSNALSMQFSITDGIVSNRAQIVDNFSYPMLQTTTSISRGSSGAPLLNEYGQVIGIISAYFLYGNDMYLSIPIDAATDASLSPTGWTLSEVAALMAEKAEEAA